jgi:hypothetical protein
MARLRGVGGRVSAQDLIDAALNNAKSTVITAMTTTVQPKAPLSASTALVSPASSRAISAAIRGP